MSKTSNSMPFTPLCTPSIAVSMSLVLHIGHHSLHHLDQPPSLLSTLPAPLTHALVYKRSNIILYTTNHKRTVYVFDMDSDSVVSNIDLRSYEVIGFFFSNHKIFIRSISKDVEKIFMFELSEKMIQQEATFDAFKDEDEDSTALNCASVSEGGALALRYIKIGCVIYYPDVNDSSKSKIIECHKGKIQCVALSPDGKWLATCSDKGTLIRVWDMEKAMESSNPEPSQILRRGSYASLIYSLSFSADGRFLIASSDSATVHIFYIHKAGEQSKNSKSLFTWERNEEKSFAWYRHTDKQIPRPPTVASFTIDGSNAWVVSEDGKIILIQYDPENGGEAKKIFERQLYEPKSSS